MEVNLTSTFFNFSDFYNPVESKNYKKVRNFYNREMLTLVLQMNMRQQYNIFAL